MKELILRFYGELNDFLDVTRKQVDFSLFINRNTSVKDVIESLGVPHPEIDLILVNGMAADFSYCVQDKDRISVYPEFSNIDHGHTSKLRAPMSAELKFVLDCNLGKLARYLRLLGFDCIYRNDFDDDEVAQTADVENRIVLTRDRFLLRRKLIVYGYFVREVLPRRQISEVMRRYRLNDKIHPFTRCTRCNGELKVVTKEQILDRLEPLTKLYYHEFKHCSSCGRIYWAGSHMENTRQLINDLLAPETDR